MTIAYEIFGIPLRPDRWGGFDGENENVCICLRHLEGVGWQAYVQHNHVECYISSCKKQDGSISWHFDTAEEALDSLMVEMKAFAKTWSTFQ